MINIKFCILIILCGTLIILKQMTEILYQDKGITLYRQMLVINKYYFPLATSKTILFSQMERISVLDTEGVTHRWGLCSKYLNNWFPLDGERKGKKKFIEIILKGKKVKPSFTPDDVEKVYQILWELFTPQGMRFSEAKKESKEKETEIAQQELMDRQKQMQLDVSEQQLDLKSKGKAQKIEK